MDYVLVEYLQPEEDEPALVYSELDQQRLEQRRVEFFEKGLCFAYGGERGHEEALNPRPFPEDLRQLNAEGKVQTHAITARLFQEIWNQAQELPDGFMGMFF